MRLAVRRSIGVGGATAVAIGAALALAIPASAHVPGLNAGCDSDTGVTTVKVDLEQYNGDRGAKNWVTLTDETGKQLLPNTATSGMDAGKAFFQTSYTFQTTESGAVDHKFTMTVFAQDDPHSKNHAWDGVFTKTTYACVKNTTTPPPPPTTTPPPVTTTNETAPPTTIITPPPATTLTTPPPSVETSPTTPAVVAAATTTPGAGTGTGSGSLPFTGVNTALPLGIAGALVVAGGGILAWLRFGPRRRKANG